MLQVDLKTSNGSTALHNAANCGHAAVVKQLLQAGAGVGQCALTGANALFNAATAGTLLLPVWHLTMVSLHGLHIAMFQRNTELAWNISLVPLVALMTVSSITKYIKFLPGVLPGFHVGLHLTFYTRCWLVTWCQRACWKALQQALGFSQHKAPLSRQQCLFLYSLESVLQC